MPPLSYFARHGQTAWNAEARLQGQADTDLNDHGRAQAAAYGRTLKRLIGDGAGFDFVASPMRRTRETMEILRREMGLDPAAYRTDARLIEVNFGDWQGHTLAELDAARAGTTAERDKDKWNFLPPGKGAESYSGLAARVAPFVDELARPTVCVTHGGVIRSLFHLIGKVPGPDVATMQVTQDHVLELRDGRLVWLD